MGIDMPLFRQSASVTHAMAVASAKSRTRGAEGIIILVQRVSEAPGVGKAFRLCALGHASMFGKENIQNVQRQGTAGGPATLSETDAPASKPSAIRTS